MTGQEPKDRRDSLAELFLQQTGTLKVKVPQISDDVHVLAGYHPSWAPNVKRRQ